MKDKTKPAEIDGILVHCAHCDLVPVGKIKPYPRNNKRHPDAQLDLLCKAIKAQGWRAPVTVSVQSGYIVRGHARYEAAKRLGLSAVPVDWQNYASDTAERADRIADNRLSELAEWDMDALKNELLELDTGELDMLLTGFDAKALEELMTQVHVEKETPSSDDLKESNPKLDEFIAAREASRERGQDKGEVNFWVCLVFQSYEQKHEFLNQVKDVPTQYGMYVDGEALARAVGLPVAPNIQKPVTVPIDKKLSEMVMS
jgi:hypothetical protein